MAMKAGQMDRRLTLRHRTLATQDANGQQVESWTEYTTVWARKLDISGREFFQAQTKDAEISTRFDIRWRDDVIATDRVTCDDIDYQLVAPPSEIGRREGLTLFAQAVVNA